MVLDQQSSFLPLLCDNMQLILSFLFLSSSSVSLFHFLGSSLCLCPLLSLVVDCLSVSSNTGGRVPASGPVWIGCWFWDWCRPALPGVPSHHLPRNQSQEPLFRPVPALSHERAVWDCRYPWGHCGDHWWGILLLNFKTSLLLFFASIPILIASSLHPSLSQSKCKFILISPHIIVLSNRYS